MMKKQLARATALGCFLICLALAAGCQTIDPNAVAVECLPPSESRTDKLKLNFLQLRQDPPVEYILAPGDVLGIYIEGITGSEDVPPPVHFPEDAASTLPPAVGFPIPIRDDGRISLPLIGPIYVSGSTIAAAEERIRRAYTIDREILQPGQERIIVTLMRRRRINVIVIREDTETITGLSGGGNQIIIGEANKGRTYSVDLPAYENDVLHALSDEAGGLPGENAKNEIIILRGAFEDARQQPYLLDQLNDPRYRAEVIGRADITRIPIRVGYNEPMPEIREEDIILDEGDVILIEGRDTEFFFTGGLLQGGQHPLPRDYDIDVLGAIAIAGGSLATSPGGESGSIAGGGTASTVFPASRVRVLRQLPNREQIQIELDLRRLIRESSPQQRLIIQPGDVVILEYRPYEVAINSAVTWFYSASFGLLGSGGGGAR